MIECRCSECCRQGFVDDDGNLPILCVACKFLVGIADVVERAKAALAMDHLQVDC
jgi:hypothetical protein